MRELEGQYPLVVYRPRRAPRTPGHGVVPAVLLAAMLMAQFTALGMNNDLLSALGALADIGLALAILWWVRPDRRLLAAMGPVLALLCCGLAWSIAPDLVFSTTGRVADLDGHLTPDLTLSSVARFAGYVAVLVAAACLGRRRNTQRGFVDAMLLLGMLNILVGLVLWRADPARIFGMSKSIHVARFTGTLQNANAAGAFYAMLALFALGRTIELIGERAYLSSGPRFAYFALVVLEMFIAFGACMATASRAGLSFAVVAVIVLLLWHSRSLGERAKHRVLAVTCIVLLLVAMLPTLAEYTFVRASTLGSDGMTRLAMWRYYLSSASAAPLWGYGPGSFGEMSLSRIATPEAALGLWNTNAAHNQLLQMLLEGGLPYLVLVLIAAGLIGYRIVRAGGEIFGRPSTSGLAAGAAVLFGCSLVDIAMTFPAIMASFLAVVGLLWGRSLEPAARRRPADAQRTAGATA